VGTSTRKASTSIGITRAGVPERSKGQDLSNLFLFFPEKKNVQAKLKFCEASKSVAFAL